MLNVVKLRNFIENVNKNSFVQNPKKWMIENNHKEFLHLIDSSLIQTKTKLYVTAYGKPNCKFCKIQHSRLISIGWKGFAKTCSEKCRQNLASKRQTDNNSSHNMTQESKDKMKIKLSSIMKNKILHGEFTPKSENYLTHSKIQLKVNDNIINVRSLWEAIYYLNNPTFEYETIRIPYFDSILQKERIYITDFYDSKTNTIFEIKPKKYHYTLKDKIDGVLIQGYKFILIDDDYFKSQKTDKMITLLENSIINYDEIKPRLKWLKKN